MDSAKCVQLSEKDYARYLKEVEEMEKLILEAKKSCERVELMRKQQLSSVSRLKRFRFEKYKSATRAFMK